MLREKYTPKILLNSPLIWQKKQVYTRKKNVWSECYDKPFKTRGMELGAKSGPGHY